MSYDNKRAVYNWYIFFLIEFNFNIGKNKFYQLIDNICIKTTGDFNIG